MTTIRRSALNRYAHRKALEKTRGEYRTGLALAFVGAVGAVGSILSGNVLLTALNVGTAAAGIGTITSAARKVRSAEARANAITSLAMRNRGIGLREQLLMQAGRTPNGGAYLNKTAEKKASKASVNRPSAKPAAPSRNGGPRGFANPTVQRAAQAARRRTGK